MGLIARAIEASGIPTLCMSSAWSITASVAAPRAVFLDFPLGHTAGRPDRPEEQLRILRDALVAFASIERPGRIVPLDYAWGEDWKAVARRAGDQRTSREAAPQYQSAADRAAAVARYGEDTACRPRPAPEVPTR